MLVFAFVAPVICFKHFFVRNVYSKLFAIIAFEKIQSRCLVCSRQHFTADEHDKAEVRFQALPA